jgi:hypothetical protein
MNPKVKNVLLIVILLACIYMVIKMFKKGKTGNILGIKVNDSDCDLTDSSVDDNTPVLYGNIGKAVELAQCRLNNYHDTNLLVDGILGDNTMIAITKHGYTVPLYPMDIKN